MANLVQTVLDALTPELNARVAASVGESAPNVSRAFGAAVPTLLAGAAERSATRAGADSVLDLIRRVTASGNPLDTAHNLAPDARRVADGQGLASSLLGEHLRNASAAVGSTAGVGANAAGSILALAAPLVLGAIGRVLGGSPTVPALQSLLAGQRGGFLSALPAGLGGLFDGASPGPSALVPPASGFSRLIPILVGLLVLGTILFFVLRSCQPREVVVPPPPKIEAPALPAVKLPPTVSLKLPGGGAIDVPEGSIGYAVARFLESNEPAPKTFIFDNLNFDTASNALTPESRPTVAALAAILKAYPKVEARVVGYTDNQGDPTANKTLSDARAATVKAELVSAGISAARITTAGMGELDPIADNTTEEGRARNRRTELVIVKK